ncbi:hypothetical protein ACHQM5_022844 [Ranunculus cassubicifolius]
MGNRFITRDQIFSTVAVLQATKASNFIYFFCDCALQATPIREEDRFIPIQLIQDCKREKHRDSAYYNQPSRFMYKVALVNNYNFFPPSRKLKPRSYFFGKKSYLIMGKQVGISTK